MRRLGGVALLALAGLPVALALSLLLSRRFSGFAVGLARRVSRGKRGQRLADLAVEFAAYRVQPLFLLRVLGLALLVQALRIGPHVVVAHSQKQERSAPAAGTIALAHLELAAPSFGLGACWAGYFNAAANLWPPMLEALNLPEGHVSFGAMMVGYPKYKYQRLPLRNEAKIIWR